MCVHNHLKMHLFTDVREGKQWGMAEITMLSALFSSIVKCLYLCYSFYQIQKIKTSSAKRSSYNFDKQKTSDLFDLFRTRFSFLTKTLIEQELQRIQNLKTKSKNCIIILEEHDYSSKTFALTMYFKKRKQCANVKDNAHKSYMTFDFYLPKIFFFIKKQNLFNYLFQKIIVFPSKYLVMDNNMQVSYEFFSKVSSVILYSDYLFQTTDYLNILLPCRSLLMKNRFFFFIWYFCEIDRKQILKMKGEIFNYLFFLTQCFESPVHTLQYSFNFSYKKLAIKKNQKKKNLTKILIEITNKYLLSKYITFQRFQFFMMTSLSTHLPKIYNRIKNNEKLSKIFTIGIIVKSFVKMNQQNFITNLFSSILSIFDFYDILSIFSSVSRQGGDLNWDCISQKKYYFLIKPFLNSVLSCTSARILCKIKKEKKRNKLEIAIRTENRKTAMYLPIHISKNKHSNWIFWIPIEFGYHHYEIIWGNKKTISLHQEFFFIPTFFPNIFSFDIRICQEKKLWEKLSLFSSKRIVSKFVLSLFFMGLAEKEKLYIEKGNDKHKHLWYNFYVRLFWLFTTENILFFDMQIFLLFKFKNISSIISTVFLDTLCTMNLSLLDFSEFHREKLLCDEYFFLSLFLCRYNAFFFHYSNFFEF